MRSSREKKLREQWRERTDPRLKHALPQHRWSSEKKQLPELLLGILPRKREIGKGERKGEGKDRQRGIERKDRERTGTERERRENRREKERGKQTYERKNDSLGEES